MASTTTHQEYPKIINTYKDNIQYTAEQKSYLYILVKYYLEKRDGEEDIHDK